MIENWYIEKIYHFNETPIFEKASVSTIIFKFIKTKKKNNNTIKVAKYFNNKKLDNIILDNLLNYVEQEAAEYFEIEQFKTNKSWILAHNDIIKELSLYENSCKKVNWSNDYHTIKDFCDIWNWMVSWLDKAFQIDISVCNIEEKKHLLSVIKAKNLKPYKHWDITNYLFLNDIVKDEKEFKNTYPNFYRQLEPYIENLNKRYQYNRKINYWEWVFLRNYKLFSRKEERIFVPCKERISNKDYFRFSLVEEKLYPTQDVTAIFKKEDTEEDIYYILALLNTRYVFDWLRFNWIVKWNIVEFSEKPIASIPYRKIDFNNNKELEIHNKIVILTKEYIKSNNSDTLEELNIEIEKLFI
jgi:adenine-specific DNA-methyltransferase